MTMNSSYVLIMITTFRKTRMGESTSPGCPVKHLILSDYKL